MMPGAGERNRLVTLQRSTDTADGRGGSTRTWADFGSAWVKANQVGAKEGLVAGVLRSVQHWRIEMRTRDISVTDRLVMAGTVLGIQSVADPDGTRKNLVLFCETEAG